MGIGELHQLRLETVVQLLKASGVRSVADLGCGSGALLQYLVAEPQFSRLLGVEVASDGVIQARRQLANHLEERGGRLTLLCRSYTQGVPTGETYEAVTLIETIEHLPLSQLPPMEAAVFAEMRPRLVLLTTPNRDYNSLYELPPGTFRDHDHHFEWGRNEFRRWCQGVAQRHGYRLTVSGIGDMHPDLGQPTHLARFERPD